MNPKLKNPRAGKFIKGGYLRCTCYTTAFMRVAKFNLAVLIRENKDA